MTVHVLITCDICDAEFRQPGTNYGFTIQDAIKEQGWQTVEYTVQAPPHPGDNNNRTQSIREIRCNACALIPEKTGATSVFGW